MHLRADINTLCCTGKIPALPGKVLQHLIRAAGDQRVNGAPVCGNTTGAWVSEKSCLPVDGAVTLEAGGRVKGEEGRERENKSILQHRRRAGRSDPTVIPGDRIV